MYLMPSMMPLLMELGANGPAIASNNTPDLIRRINELAGQGIPVVTFSTDALDSKRLCFVGMDNYRAGQAAAGLVRQLLSSCKERVNGEDGIRKRKDS